MALLERPAEGGLARATRQIAHAIVTPIRRAASRVGQVLAGYFGLPYAGYGGYGPSLNRVLSYGAVSPDSSSIVIACVRWVQRTFTEAPPILEEWVEEREEWAQHQRGAFLALLETPNPYYNGSTLWKATIADRILSGTAYWIKVRSPRGTVAELWWAPSSTITPRWDANNPDVFITHYDYSPDGKKARELRVEDVVRFPDGIDPHNPRLGLSAMRSLLREIFTDDEAAAMTAALLRNMGVPGVVIAPKQGTLSEEAAKRMKADFIAKTTGDKRGEPFVTEGGVQIDTFGFSPEQMQLRAIRGIPEERITAVLGVNAAVVGLGAGLSTTKVGATLREYREEAFESTIIPMYRELASELTHQLLDDFKEDGWRAAFDLSKVRVLQDDENKRTDRVIKEIGSGAVTVAEGRRKLGYVALPEHDVYLRSKNVVAVPAGQTPEDQAAQSEAEPDAGTQMSAALKAAVQEALEGARA